MYSKNQQLGFTLIELMIAVAILAIAVTVGIPSYNDLIANNRMASEINDFVGSLQIARSEAIKRGLNVRVCASSNGTSCATTGDWDQGWIVEVVATGEDLRIQPAFTSGDTLVGTGTVVRTISFDRNGLVNGANTDIKLCESDNDDQKARAVQIGFTGQVTLKTHSSDNITCP